MIDTAIVNKCLVELEKQVRLADEAVESAATPAMRLRAKRQRNAINAACNALFRFRRI